MNFFFFLGFPLLDFDGGQEDDDSLTRSTYQSAMHGLTNILLILLGAFYRDPLPTTPQPAASIPFCPSVLFASLADVLLLDLGGLLPWGARTVIFLILTVCCSSRSLSLISPFQRKSQEEIKSYDYPLLSLKLARLSFQKRLRD